MKSSYGIKVAVTAVVFLAVCAVALLLGISMKNENSADVLQGGTEEAAGMGNKDKERERDGSGGMDFSRPNINDELSLPSIEDKRGNSSRGALELPEGTVELVTGESCREIYAFVGDATFRAREFPREWGPSTVISGKFTKYSEATGELFFTTNKGELILFIGGAGAFFTQDCPSY